MQEVEVRDIEYCRQTEQGCITKLEIRSDGRRLMCMQVAQKSAAPHLGSVGGGMTEAPASTSSLVQDAPTGVSIHPWMISERMCPAYLSIQRLLTHSNL
jgi:hypothetical protein